MALRKYLLDNDLGAKESGGNVDVLPTANPDTLNLFKQGEVDGAWAPEPWATRLIQEAGGEIFLDERELWPEGQFVTTHLIVSTDFLEKHPTTVEKLVEAHVETTEWINENPMDARELVNKGIEEVTGAALPAAVIDTAWENVEVTHDPVSSSLFGAAAAAKELGFIDEVPDANIYALDLLNQVLADKGIATVKVEGEDTGALSRWMAAHLRATIVCVDPRQVPEDLAGREYDEALLAELPATADPCGERGEFHTFVRDAPNFASPIEVSAGEIVTRDGFRFADIVPA